MTTLAELIVEPPTEGLYMLLHPAQRQAMRLSVRMAVVDNTVARWGSAIWGTDVWASAGGHWEWLDMTGLVRGFEWTRGATGLSDRPEVGTCNMSLAWEDGFLNLVENSTFPHPDFLREGALWQFVVSADTLYSPPPSGGLEEAFGYEVLFTGVVETMREHTAQQWVDAWIDVTLSETASLAAAHDDPEVPVRGYGDNLELRLNRVLGIDPPRSKPWEFGLIGDPTGNMADFVTYQSTNLAQSMLTEAYLVVDTVHFDVYSDRTGAMKVIDRTAEIEWRARPGGDDLVFSLYPDAEVVDTGADTAHIPYGTDDGFGFEKNSDDVANVVIASAVGGTEYSIRDGGSRAKRGQRTTGRNDLLMTDTGGHVQEWAQRELDARRELVLHCGPVKLDAAMGTTIGEALATLDIHTAIEVNVPNRDPVPFVCAGYTMSLLPLDEHGNTVWLAEITLRPTIGN